MIHHANLLIGTPEEAESYLRTLCNDLNIEVPNNPDFFIFRTATFGIDEAREVRILSVRKALTGKKIFLILSERLTTEAQNALLKTFEDPFPNTHFFLAVKEEDVILPTLRSRMLVIRVSKSLDKMMISDAEKFLTLSVKDRLLFAREFAEREKSLPAFMDGVLTILRKRQEARRLMESAHNIRRFANDTAVAPRLIIEHLALILP